VNEPGVNEPGVNEPGVNEPGVACRGPAAGAAAARRAFFSIGALGVVAPRAWLAAAAGCTSAAGTARAHGALGPLAPPRPAPPMPLTLHDGHAATLPGLLRGRVTALQLMFTGCSATCPIQGASFAALQPLVFGVLPRSQLLSLSIDPLSDDAAALAAWRRKFGAGEGWLAAAPPVRHVERLLDYVAGRPAAARAAERHNAQVFLFDSQGRLAYRLAEFAAPRDVARAMHELAQLAT